MPRDFKTVPKPLRPLLNGATPTDMVGAIRRIFMALNLVLIHAVIIPVDLGFNGASRLKIWLSSFVHIANIRHYRRRL